MKNVELKIIKRFLAGILSVFVMISVYTPAYAESVFSPPADINSDAVYFVNTDTNNVVYEKNSDKQIVPASLVKMMTVIIALETADEGNMDSFLNQTVNAKRYIFDRLYGLNASTADIRPDENLPMKDVLYAAMLPSACEATMILADYVDGEDTNAFVDKMNNKAKEIGMDNTIFVDPDGLDEAKQRSTAKDMYKLTEYCMQNETFKEIATSQQYIMSATNKHAETRRVQHTNHMTSKFLGGSYYDKRVKGIKTGTAAGIKNLISEAEDENYHYILVTLGAPDNGKNLNYADHQNIYEWAFSTLRFVTVGKPSEKIIPNNIKVNFGKKTDSIILTPKNSVVELIPKSIDPSAVIWDTSSLPKELNAPVKKGDVIGKVSIKLSGTELGQVEVVADKDIKINLVSFISYYFKKVITSYIFWIIILIFVILLILYIYIIKKHTTKSIKRKYKNKRYR